jgi:hypothetical protein
MQSDQALQLHRNGPQLLLKACQVGYGCLESEIEAPTVPANE